MVHLWNLLLTFTGANNPSGRWYGFWSGFAGDLFIFGGIVTWYRRHNCHQTKCPRLGKHPVEGTPYTVCKKHHPDVPKDISEKHIRR